MLIISEKWKIFQTDKFEYILLASGKNSQKIKGKNATEIVDVLNELQIKDSFQEAIIELKKKFDVEFINNIIEWLEFNNFVERVNDNVAKKINLIGEFSEDERLLSDFITNLPIGLTVNNYVNLSKTKKIELIKGQTTLLIAPFWYNEKNILKVSDLMINSEDDFFYIELYCNGLTIGPLLNSSKGTACLNCIETRKLFNSSNPSLIIENIISKELINENTINVLEIGHYSFNKTFIYNELVKILLNNNKSLYSKSLFMDFNKYENFEFKVIKAPNCIVCNPQAIFNPL